MSSHIRPAYKREHVEMQAQITFDATLNIVVIYDFPLLDYGHMPVGFDELSFLVEERISGMAH